MLPRIHHLFRAIRSSLCSSCLLLFLLSSAVSVAQDSDDDILYVERPWDFGIALGYGELSNPFLGADDVPAHLNVDFAWYGKKFFFDNGTLGYTLIDRTNQGLSVVADYSSDRIYHSYFNTLGVRVVNGAGVPVVDPQFDGNIDFSPAPPGAVIPLEVPDREFALNVGLEYLIAGQWGQLQTSFTTDVSSRHDGHEASITLSRGWQRGRFGLAASLGTVWKSDDLVDYYYGLDAEENPGRNIEYQGQSTVNTMAELSLTYQVHDHISLISQVRHERLGSGITDSPLIDSDHTRSLFVGLFFHY